MESSLYIHVPFCRQKCDYCDFFSVGEKDRREKMNDISDDYIRAVVNEAKFYADFFDIKSWSSIYLGGGTPGILSENQLFDLISGVKNAVQNQKNCEITVEVNPENVTESKIKILEKAGANRISMGIQALDDKALRAVNRKSDTKTILNALNLLEKSWNGRISVDFIAGLPNQTYDSFKNQFKILDDFKKIGHVSLYTLTIEENTSLAKKIDSGKVRFSSDKADKMWILGRNILEKKGFLQYEVSNFARPGEESVHNSSYWKQKNYIGCGSGAVGTVYDFESKKAVRWTNTYSIPKYVEFWSQLHIQKDVHGLGGCTRKESKEERKIHRLKRLAQITNSNSNPDNSENLWIKNLPQISQNGADFVQAEQSGRERDGEENKIQKDVHGLKGCARKESKEEGKKIHRLKRLSQITNSNSNPDNPKNLWIKNLPQISQNGADFMQAEQSGRKRDEEENPQIQKDVHGLKGCARKQGEKEENLLGQLAIRENPCPSVFIRVESLRNLPASLETLDESTLEFEFLMTGFRQLSGVSSKEYSERFGKSLEERIGAENGVFAKWKAHRLARVAKSTSDRIYSLNKRGIMLLNRFLEDLI